MPNKEKANSSTFEICVMFTQSVDVGLEVLLYALMWRVGSTTRAVPPEVGPLSSKNP